MKKIKYILLSIFMANGFMACEDVDFGDKNKNVNGPTEPYPAGLMSNAIMAFSTYTGRPGLMQPTLYVQYQSQVTYTDEMRYAGVPTSWFTYYNDALASIQAVIDYASDEANRESPLLLSQGHPDNQIGVARILKSVIFKRVTDTYGDVPYSEAFKGTDNLSPAYDSQESIYKALISDVKAARDMLDPSLAGPTGDIIYGGDVAAWRKFANSFLLQLSIQLSKRYPGSGEYAATEFNAALNHAAGVIESVDEEAWFPFEDNEGFRNPWFANRTPDYFLSAEFADALQGRDSQYNPTSNRTFDDRIYVYATDAGNGVPYGYEDGSGSGAISVSNDNYWAADTPLPLLTASYTYLNRADAANMGWTSEDATAMLIEGIIASYNTLDAHFGTDISDNAATYAATRVADIATAADGIAQVIGEEKWVSLFGQGFDAWSEWRRTGYPSLTPATDYLNDGNIPRRYLYPSEESTLNGVNYDAAVGRLSPGEDKNTARVWWDKE